MEVDCPADAEDVFSEDAGVFGVPEALAEPFQGWRAELIGDEVRDFAVPLTFLPWFFQLLVDGCDGECGGSYPQKITERFPVVSHLSPLLKARGVF